MLHPIIAYLVKNVGAVAFLVYDVLAPGAAASIEHLGAVCEWVGKGRNRKETGFLTKTRFLAGAKGSGYLFVGISSDAKAVAAVGIVGIVFFAKRAAHRTCLARKAPAA